MADVNLRRVALSTLTEVWERGAYLNAALDAVFDESNAIDRRGRAYLTRLCFGTEEKLLFLDAVIDYYSSAPAKKLRPVIRGALRLATYEIYYMDSVPEHAIVDEYVKLIKKRGLASLSGFANGVLRAIIRDGRDADEALARIVWSSEGMTLSGGLSLSYSIPEWIIKKWLLDYGEDVCRRICEGFLEAPQNTIWTNTSPIEIKRLSGAIEDVPGYAGGEFYVQDISSMQPVFMADIRQGERVLDVCAAPGGKSLLAARHGAVVEARDISPEKVDRIIENARRMHMYAPDEDTDASADRTGTVTASVWDATADDPDSHGMYDVVIADLPCSGLGVLGKKPDIRYRVAPDDIDALARLQSQILDTVCEYVRGGGRLVFSTCTITRRENDANVTGFLETHPDFELREQRQLFPKSGECDGFFVAVFNKAI